MLDTEIKTEKTLNKNQIKRFILRIDLSTPILDNEKEIINKLSKYFDRTEKRQITNFNVHFTSGISEVSRNQMFDYVLVSENKSLTLTLSESQNALWIDCNSYRNNLIYKEVMGIVIDTYDHLLKDSISNRIGMRYVNEFNTLKLKDISNIFNKEITSIIRNMVKNPNISRAISVEEYNYSDYKARIQYGIPNKFYPSILNIYDSLLDIDCYDDTQINLSNWNVVLTKLNHSAYDFFLSKINEKYIEVLR